MKVYTILFTFFVAILSVNSGLSQAVAVSGYIINERSTEFISSASVFEVTDGIGTITDNNGFYKLILKPGIKDLHFSNPGFRELTQSFELKSDTVINIKLSPKVFEKVKHKLSPVLGANNILNDAPVDFKRD